MVPWGHLGREKRGERGGGREQTDKDFIAKQIERIALSAQNGNFNLQIQQEQQRIDPGQETLQRDCTIDSRGGPGSGFRKRHFVDYLQGLAPTPSQSQDLPQSHINGKGTMKNKRFSALNGS